LPFEFLLIMFLHAFGVATICTGWRHVLCAAAHKQTYSRGDGGGMSAAGVGLAN
jgi:hypothetical protein